LNDSTRPDQRSAGPLDAAALESECRRLIEHASEVFWLTDVSKQQVLYVSPAYEQVWGRSCDSLYAAPLEWLEAVHPEDRERVRRALADQRTGAYHEEYRIVRPDGSIRYILDRAFPVRGDDGEISRIVGLALDVTEQRRGEKTMRRLSSAVEQTADAVMITDRSGVIEYVNRAFEEITGYSRDEAVGRPASLLASGQHGPAFYRRLWERLERGESVYDTFTNRRKDGSVFIEAKTISPLKDATGEITHFVATGRNITERRRKQERLRETEARLRAIIDAEPEGLFTVDEAGSLVDCNTVGLAMLGADQFADVLGAPMLRFVAPEHTVAYREFQRDVLRGGKQVLESETVNLQGARRWVEAHAVPLRTGDDSRRYMLSIVRDVTERRRAEERLAYMSQHDTLTGLPNRRLLLDEITRTAAEARMNNRLAGVAVLDVNHFKNVNAPLGHAAGDALLRRIGTRLARALRESDTISRISGDMFGIVLADIASTRDAAIVAEKILGVFAEPFQFGDHVIQLSAGFGIVLHEGGDTADSLLRHAEIALHRAKERGGRSASTYQLYAAEMKAHIERRLTLEGEIRRGLESEQFVLHYQPVVRARSGRIAAAEALLRWQHPRLGLVFPGDFIGVAEQTGLIVPLGAWALRSACAEAKRWADAGFSIPVHVNVSAPQITNDGLLGDVAAALEHTGLNPRLLTIEITESMLLQNTERILECLRAIRELGVATAIDDFGTHYSSFSYVKRFRVDHLKIDRSFVQGLSTSSDDSAITNAMIVMAHSLGMRVTAEGVETLEQADILRGQSCDWLQGYLYSKPVAAEAFLELLQDGSGSLAATRTLR
jgi:diguanylate cyclase (GGDEF)-like protein/PAS domain S-box-containing protein